MRKFKLLKVYGSDCYECGGNMSFANAVKDSNFVELSDEDCYFLRENLYRLNKRDETYVLIEEYTDTTNYEKVFNTIKELIDEDKRERVRELAEYQQQKEERAKKAIERKQRQLEKLRKELEGDK